MSCDYCGVELQSHPFFYKVGRFLKEDVICPVRFGQYFRWNVGKDRVRRYDSKTTEKLDG